MEKICINPKELFDSRQYGFSQIVLTGPGALVLPFQESVIQIVPDNVY